MGVVWRPRIASAAVLALALAGCGTLSSSAPASSAPSSSAAPSGAGPSVIGIPTAELTAHQRCLVDHGFRLVKVDPSSDLPGYNGTGHTFEANLSDAEADAAFKACALTSAPVPVNIVAR